MQLARTVFHGHPIGGSIKNAVFQIISNHCIRPLFLIDELQTVIN